VPFIEIRFEDLEFDKSVQTFCISAKFKCPNYGHSWACPPEAPYLEEQVSKFKKFFLIYSKFDLTSHVKEIKAKHPKRSEESIRNKFFLDSYMRDTQEKEILQFIEDYDKPYKEILILWDGHCRLCYTKDKKKCTYDSGKQCRYPNKKRYSMEAVGIHVTNTVTNLNLDIEWPPVNNYYRFGLICIS
jgi:predicted metal-binding protein